MKVLLLGTGTSTGVPQIGCNCYTCTSTNIKDQRLRSSLLVSEKNQILIDWYDLRQRLLNYRIHQQPVFCYPRTLRPCPASDDLRPLDLLICTAKKSFKSHRAKYTLLFWR